MKEKNLFFSIFVRLFIGLGVCVLLLNVYTAFCLLSANRPTLLGGLGLGVTVALDILYVFFCKYVFAPLRWVKQVSSLGLTEEAEYRQCLAKVERTPLLNFVYQLFSTWQETSNRKRDEELLKNQVRFKELESQINPHFLYNTLESIRGQALMENVPEIANMAKMLSAFFRYNISSAHSLVTFQEEVRNIRNYFSIQQFRFGNKLDLEISYDEGDDFVSENLMPKLTLQPIIENAIFHGLETRMEKGKITISTTVTQSRMIIVVSDNGIGMQAEELNRLNEKLTRGEPEAFQGEKHSGIALTNVDKRIKLCFGNEYGLIVRSIYGIGTDVEIVLPIVK